MARNVPCANTPGKVSERPHVPLPWDVSVISRLGVQLRRRQINLEFSFYFLFELVNQWLTKGTRLPSAGVHTRESVSVYSTRVSL